MQMTGKPTITEHSIPEELFLKVRQEAEEKYKRLEPVYCPYLKSKVHFTVRGLDHIKMKSWQKARVRADQYTRFKLLYLAPEIIKISHTVQGKKEAKEWERQKKHGKWEKILKNVVYFEFVAVIGKVRIKVIVKEVEGKEKQFISIIPFWRMIEGEVGKRLHDLDVENDADFNEDHD